MELNLADPTSVTVTFDDMFVLETGGSPAFAINWNEEPTPPPYYITVDGRRFAYTGMTFLIRGHGAPLPNWVRDEEGAGHLVLFVERNNRLMGYSFDPSATDDEGEDGEGDAS